ncbi:DNA mismatch repair endonuclease MutL [Halorussus lipolyticus]|uniref:DNA mismatch repair endonuclease MutL n=1 Tax=Halorussus lipolyticus TaxID=3034024 RepID=UPI0023E8EACA|nr:DNA mismatch repair endonuclease MutL [Halorussus sp. DT80]
MSDRITQLDDATIRKIAAGEVVERPSSVVKELVENSLDADADRIDVTVEEGGIDRIAVSDDGIGMSEDDLRTAVREHTTSKIEDADDLDSGVTTLGFRGEALHTIGAVSRTTIRSKPRDGATGTELRMEDGEVESVGPAGCPEGTTVEVEDLFYNTPARRKYLKTTTTEFSHVNTVVTRYALANPDVAVSLTHDGREVFVTTGRGDLQSALLSVYGREVATSMIEVGEARSASEQRAATPRATGESPDGAVSVTGYVSNPETTRSTREYISTYVNGRYVSSPVVRDALVSAYGGQLSAERYPFAVLFVTVPPEEVDVNVHPRKMECRWSQEGAVKRAVETTVEDALLDHGLVRSSAPRGRSAPDETRVEPERERDGASESASETGEQAELTAGGDAEREQSTLDSSASTDARNTAEDVSNNSKQSVSKSESKSGTATSRTESVVPERGNRTPTAKSGVSAETTATSSPSASSTGGDADFANSGDDAASGSSTDDDGDSGRESVAEATGPTTEQRGSSATRKFSAPTESATLAGDSTDDPEFESLPRMRILGQLHDTYITAETPDGMVLVDQHAADERVNYERLREEFADDSTTQMLAQPVELELTAGEAAVFDEYREALERLGFRAELAGDREVVVRTAPTVLDATLDPELLRDALAEFVSTDPDHRGDTVEAVADDLLADLACYPSITGNTSLGEGSVVDLLSALDDCENPYACPHGRPVIIEFGEEEIEDRFERDYPGHAGRRGE